jgi:hypothetical protein
MSDLANDIGSRDAEHAACEIANNDNAASWLE